MPTPEMLPEAVRSGSKHGNESKMSLAQQFSVAGGIVMLVAVLAVGGWISNRIKRDVVRNSANSAALFMESFLSPLSQELARSDQLSPGALRALDEVLNQGPLANRIAAFKIWKPDGLIVAANDPTIVGKRFPVTENLAAAFDNDIRAEFRTLWDDTGLTPDERRLPLLEIYSPVREVWSGRIVAVAEIYEINETLQADLLAARRTSWVAVFALMLVIGGALFGIVLRGSRKIDRQTRELNEQLSELRTMSRLNERLRRRVQGAAGRISAMNDHALRRVGSDLHDGPAQLLAIAALHLDPLETCQDEQSQESAKKVRNLLTGAMDEIRLISKGLLLPDIASVPIRTLVSDLVEAHENRTGSVVEMHVELGSVVDLPEAVRICIYRFAQEGLNNAWRHARGVGQALSLTVSAGKLRLGILDRGPGLPESVAEDRLGLNGLRDRVEALGGEFHAGPREGGGTEIRMDLEIQETYHGDPDRHRR
ncbi:MAG: sensor histidine kinase [Marinibacterium sp.]